MHHEMVFGSSHRVLVIKHTAHGLKGLMSKGRVKRVDLHGPIVVKYYQAISSEDTGISVGVKVKSSLCVGQVRCYFSLRGGYCHPRQVRSKTYIPKKRGSHHAESEGHGGSVILCAFGGGTLAEVRILPIRAVRTLRGHLRVVREERPAIVAATVANNGRDATCGSR